jgi:hypothetical protein
MLSLENLVTTLELAISPVILISGVGLLLLTMNSRIARVVDRARFVAAACEAAEGGEREACYAKLGVLCRRAKFLRLSMTLAALSVLFVTVLFVLLFCGALFQFEVASLVIALFMACMCSLIGSLAVFIADVNLSLQALWLDFPATDGSNHRTVGASAMTNQSQANRKNRRAIARQGLSAYTPISSRRPSIHGSG